jgi:hypothetical protein
MWQSRRRFLAAGIVAAAAGAPPALAQQPEPLSPDAIG